MNMKLRNIPFSPPEMTEAEAKLASEAILSGWITTGPKTKEFERQIAAYIGVPKAVCLNSATAAMEMALRLIGVGPDDEVIVPAYTYTASASVTQHVGCKLVLVDSQPDNVEMDYDKLAEAITEKTKVICPVDLGGIVCDFDKVFAVVEAKKHLFRPANELQKRIGRIIVAADDAHAFGAQWHGKKAGAIAELAREVGARRVVVFGDNRNDIAMMQAADHSVAMGNAFPEVKAAASEVIGPNTADSVPRWIEADLIQS